jgi:CheY-like chemotaxis protein
VQCDDLWVQADLAVNSRDAMSSGGLFRVHGAHGPDEDFVELRIVDTGSGMSEEVLAKAFEPFFTTKGIGKGSGLGLAQVYAMANRVGGRVRVDSDGKSGTTVTISLRRADPTRLDSIPAPLALAAGASEQFDILVVDDDHQVRMPLVDLLKSLGHRVLEAASGEEALAVLDDAAVQILLCDFAMPGMNGVAVANLARASKPELSVVFMSGYADGDELRDAVGHNATMLRKPFDTDAVRRAIGNAAGRVRG